VTAGPPAESDAHETGFYGGGRPRLASLAAPLLSWFDRYRLTLVRRDPPARLLDAGAGRGRFVATARDAGYDAYGIEPSQRGIEGALVDYGLTLEQAMLDEADVEPESLDVITLWHVLEHVDDPGETLRLLRGWLRPGGVVLVGVPNLGSLQAELSGSTWYHFDIPRHRTHLTPAGLEIMMHNAGLDVVETTHVLAEHNPFGMWQSMVNRLTTQPSYFAHLLKRNAPLWSRDLVITVAMLPLIPVAIVAELIAGLFHRGGTVAMLARRRVP
jgi:2-polyprenyl-3-methyl-5-hydroxy-6-metoxy-1,4-benzoquinol methylase